MYNDDMKDSLKNYGAKLAEDIAARFQSEELKQLVTQTKAASDGDTGTFEVVITTENLDRYNEVIKLDGWQLANYLNNPIVLWMHDHTQPIGVATSLAIKDGKMVAQGKFAPNAMGQQVRQLYDAGIIKATSVGFIELEREGNLITKAELLEFSFVSVPANPYALSLAMERGLSVNELVTKGMMVIEKEAQHEDPANGDEQEEDEEVQPEVANDDDPVEPESRAFGTKQLSPVIDSLKAAVVALEALGTKSEESEGDEDEPEANPEQERSFAEFTATRRAVQGVATAVGDVLAEMRQIAEANR